TGLQPRLVRHLVHYTEDPPCPSLRLLRCGHHLEASLTGRQARVHVCLGVGDGERHRGEAELVERQLRQESDRLQVGHTREAIAHHCPGGDRVVAPPNG